MSGAINHPRGYKFGNSAPAATRSGSSYLQIENYLSKGAAPPPPSIVWNWAIAWGMALNDRIGCCVVAARAHEVTNATYQTAGLAQYVPDPAVLTAYEAISGYSPNVPGSDVG